MLSRTLTIHRTAGKGREPFFIPFYQLHWLTNIQTFICNFACEMTITYFQSHRLYLPDCYSMKFTTLSNYHLIEWWCEVSFCLFTRWFDTFFVTAILIRETGGLELASDITLVLKVNRLTKCASHPCYSYKDVYRLGCVYSQNFAMLFDRVYCFLKDFFSYKIGWITLILWIVEFSGWHLVDGFLSHSVCLQFRWLFLYTAFNFCHLN